MTDNIELARQQMEQMGRDLEDVAAWLDHVNPDLAAHRIARTFTDNRERCSDMIEITIIHAKSGLDYRPLTLEATALVHRQNEAINLRAKSAICALGHRFIDTGGVRILSSDAYSARDFSAHRRIEAIRRVEAALASAKENQ